MSHQPKPLLTPASHSSQFDGRFGGGGPIAVSSSMSSSSSSSSSSMRGSGSGSTQVSSMMVQPLLLDVDASSGSGAADSADPASAAAADPDAHLTFPSVIVMPGWPQVVFLLVVGIVAALAFTVLKEPLEHRGVTSGDLLRYGSIPLISIVFTYLHIWLALWMTFYPLDYFGILQIPGTNTGLGWQGIIPFKSEKMARMAVQLMTQRLFNIREIFGRLDPARVAAEMGPALHTTLDEVITSVAETHSPDLWSLLPQSVKRELVNQAHEDAPPAIQALMLEMQEHIEEIFDIEEMVVSTLTKDKPLLNNIFIQCGHAELSFIRNSGAYMGGLFGLIQMIIWIFYANKWLLPGIGFVVGTLTNWLALKMIFEPVHPHYPCGVRGVRIQGLFLQRQAEVSVVYARTISKKVLNSRNILSSLIAGPMTDRLFELVYNQVKRVCDDFTGGAVTKPLIHISLGSERFARIKDDIAQRFLERVPALMTSLEAYTDEALDMEVTIRDKMAALPPDQFEGLLHPVFQEDEWKLVLMGGVLGVLIGFAQIQILGG